MQVGAHSPEEQGDTFDAKYESEEENQAATDDVEPGSGFVPRLEVSLGGYLPETEDSPSGPEHIAVEVKE